MKKWLLIILCILWFPIGVFASTNTYTRTEENPLLPDDVVIDSSRVMKDVFKIPAVEASEKVYDFSNLLAESEEEKIYEQVKQFVYDSRVDVVVATIEDLKGLDLATYVSHFYNYNKFLDDGIYFFFYTDKEKNTVEAQIKFMGEAKKRYSKEEVDSIEEEFLKQVENKKYYKAISTSLEQFIKIYNDQVKAEMGVPWLEIVMISASVTFIIVIFFVSRLHSNNVLKYKDNLNKKIDEDTMVLQKEVEDYLGVIVSKK